MSRKPKVSPDRPRDTSAAKARTLAGGPDPENLPAVSKQTAGGIAGAMVGGVVAGPVGAVVGGVVGAMVGNASAHGERPVGRAVDNLRAITEEPARRAYVHISEAMTKKKTPAKKPARKKAPAGGGSAKMTSAKRPKP